MIDQKAYFHLTETLAIDPEQGAIIQGGGGARKMRLARTGGGKSGGFRVIYYYVSSAGVVYLIAIFAKKDLGNIGQAEVANIKRLVAALDKELEG